MIRRIALLIAGAAIGVAAPAGPARAQDAPVDLEVMLAVDSSGSMWPVISAAKAAANEFVTTMPAAVRIGVVAFGTEVVVLSPPTTDRALLAQRIDGITPSGRTALYDAVVVAADQFTLNADQRVLVVLSDGRDDGSLRTLEDAKAAVDGEIVETISLTTSQTDLTSLAALGSVTPAADSAGVSAAFTRVADLVAAEVLAPTTIASTVVPTTAMPRTTAPPPTSTAGPTTTDPATETTTPLPVLANGEPHPPVSSGGGPTSDPRLALWVGAGGIFAALFALALVVLPGSQVSGARLGIERVGGVSGIGKRTMSAVDDVLERRGSRDRLATALVVAGIGTPLAQLVGIVVVVALVAGVVAFALAGPLLAVAAAGFVCLGVRSYVRRATAKRRRRFADQLPDVLQLVVTALRSGYGLTQALGAIGDEAEEPARSEFARVLVETRMGRDLSDAMRALARRMDAKDLEWVVSAIDINRDTGGNLSEILASVCTTIRERQRLVRQVMTLTSEGRFSGQILTALPFLMALLQWRTNPALFANLTHGAGLVALAIAGVFMVLGIVWTRRIVASIAL